MKISLGLLILSLSMYLAQAELSILGYATVAYKPRRIMNPKLDTLGLKSVSPNMNNMNGPRNGRHVKDTNDGFDISPGGYLYEKLGNEYAESINLTGKAFRFRYSLKNSGKVKITFMQKRLSRSIESRLKHPITSPLFELVATDHHFEFEAGTKKYRQISLSDFTGADAFNSYAIKIYGPLTVHRIELVGEGKLIDLTDKDIETVDECKKWVDFSGLSQSIQTTLFKANTYDPQNLFMNLNLGGGGETWDMRNRSFMITYTAPETMTHRVYVQQEDQTGNEIWTRLFVDELVFNKGKDVAIIINMKTRSFLNPFEPVNIHGLSIEGRINIHKVEILIPNGSAMHLPMHFRDRSPISPRASIAN